MTTQHDMFDQVIELVDSSTHLENQLRQWADGSVQSAGRWSNFTDGLLRRKPSKESLKQTKKQHQNNLFYTNEKVKFIIQNSKAVKSPSNVGIQLQRLQNNLMTTISKHKNPIERTKQRKIMKRLKGQKQNSVTVPFQITSQQLQCLGEDQQLKDILLTISRFHDKQKQKNSQLSLQLAALTFQVDIAEQSLQQERREVQKLRSNIASFRREAQRKEIEMLQSIVNSSLL